MADFDGNIWFGDPALTAARQASIEYPANAIDEPGGGPCPPTGGITNRVWYTPGAFEVRWVTPSPDPTGAFYPGPGTFGVDTVQYTVDDPVNA